MATEPDWTIGFEEAPEGRISTSAEGMFHKIYIPFTDRETGEQKVAEAGSSPQGSFLMERAVHAKQPISEAEAQATADEAAAVLGGRPLLHAWLTLRRDQLLTHRTGSRSADEIKEGDSIRLEGGTRERLLFVHGLVRDTAAGTIVVILGEEGHDSRLDVELKLLALERGLS
jgi:hypothetical protein